MKKLSSEIVRLSTELQLELEKAEDFIWKSQYAGGAVDDDDLEEASIHAQEIAGDLRMGEELSVVLGVLVRLGN